MWIVAAAYLLPFVDRGWIPHDEGVLGQSAERVVRGELPHRDYQELYTGGLSYFHSAVFRLRGIRIHSLREAFLLFSLLFLPAFYAAALRFGGVVRSSVLTLLALVWTVPNHFSSMPSWYNLFLATFATLALFRHAERGARWPAFVAGACAGVAVLVKLHGLFVVAAGVLALVFREEATAPEIPRGRARAFFYVKSAALALFVAALGSVVAKRPAAMEFLHFVVPAAALCGVLVAREARREGPPSGIRARRLVSALAPFAAGVAMPVVAFLLLYRNDFQSLHRGLFAGPSARLTTPRLAVWLPPVSSLVSGLLLGVAVFVLPGLLRTPKARWTAAAGAAALGAVLMVATRGDATYREVVLSARTMGVVAVLAACAVLLRRPGAPGTEDSVKLFAAAAMAALVLLVQFPFAAPIYLCYAVPPVLLTVAAVLRAQAPGRAHPVLAVAAAFFLAFGVFRANVGSVYSFGNRYAPARTYRPLRIERAGILVAPAEADVYEALTAAVRDAAGGEPIFAGPDCPEVPFLAGVPNRSPSLVAFLAGPIRAPEPHLALLRNSGARAVVVNLAPPFSPLVSEAVLQALAREFPASRSFGRFTVFWRDARSPEGSGSRMIGAR